MRRGRRNLWMTLPASSGLWTTRFWRAANDSPSEETLASNLILIQNNRLVAQDRPTKAGQRQISAGRWPFPLRPDGGRKDFKVSRVVEMEWASRVTVTRTVARSLDRRTVDLARQASTHAAITHPKREVAIQA